MCVLQGIIDTNYWSIIGPAEISCQGQDSIGLGLLPASNNYNSKDNTVKQLPRHKNKMPKIKTTNTWNECVTSMCKRCLKSASLDLSWYLPRKLRTSSLFTFKIVSSSCFTCVLRMGVSKLHWVLTLCIMKDHRSHPYTSWEMKELQDFMFWLRMKNKKIRKNSYIW